MIRAAGLALASLFSLQLSAAAFAAPVGANLDRVVVINGDGVGGSHLTPNSEVLVYTDDDGRTVHVFSDRNITRAEAEARVARAQRLGDHARLEGLRLAERGREEAERGRLEGEREVEEGRREAYRAQAEAAQARVEGRRAAAEGRRAAAEARWDAAQAREEAREATLNSR